MTAQVSPVAPPTAPTRKSGPPERKYKCSYCERAFSRSEHRLRHERSHTKERPFRCYKCQSSFVRRDLLLRHDRTVHKPDSAPGGVTKQRGPRTPTPLAPSTAAPAIVAAATAMVNASYAPSTPSSFGTAASYHEQLDESNDDYTPDVAAANTLAKLQQNARIDAEEPAAAHSDLPHIRSRNHTPASGQLRSDSPYLSHPARPAGGSPHAQQHLHQAWEARQSGQPPAWSSAASSSQSPHPSNSVYSSQHNLDHSPTGSHTTILSSSNSFGSRVEHAARPTSHYAGSMSQQASLPSILNSRVECPRFETDAQVKQASEATQRHGSQSAEQYYGLRDRHTLNAYLTSYFTHFHPHLPFLHPASFRPHEVAPPLLFAVLSIGALYSQKQADATWFHLGAQELVRFFVDSKESFSSRECPLWSLQSTMLNMFYASWSGSPDGLEWACSIKGLLSNMLCGDVYRLKRRFGDTRVESSTQAEWLEQEACRRTYYAVYILFGMLTITYNHGPGIRFDDISELPLPSSELLWNHELTDETNWQKLLKSVTEPLSFSDANNRLFEGNNINFSMFGSRVMINAIFLEVWSYRRSPRGLQDMAIEYKLHRSLDAWERSLNFSGLVNGSGRHESSEYSSIIFNGRSVARASRAKLFVDLKNVQEALRYHHTNEVATAMTKTHSLLFQQNSNLLPVIEDACEALNIALHPRAHWLETGLPTSHSVEYPTCTMELIVVLAHWLHRHELNGKGSTKQEQEIYDRVRNFFDDKTLQQYGDRLGWLVAALWGNLISDSSVWGISQSMGISFKHFANMLVTDPETSQPRAVHPKIPSNVQVLGVQAAY